MGLFETLRRWVDGEDAAGDPLEQAAAKQVARPASQEFIVKIARGIGEVMKAEAVPYPPDKLVIPPEYIVFLSDDDDREWQGMKRRALEEGLHHVLAEHAREVSGKTKLATTSFSVELRVDGTLPKGDVRVHHSWEESSSTNKTMITPRQPSRSPAPSGSAAAPAVADPGFAVAPVTSSLNAGAAEQVPATIAGGNMASGVAPTLRDLNPPSLEEGGNANDDATRVTPRGQTNALTDDPTQVAGRELYRLEIWRDNQRQAVVPISKSEISIGRKSQKAPSDVQLENDAEISRPHAVITRQPNGEYTITHKGKNPTVVSARELPADEPQPITPGEPIVICSYLLRIQP